MIQALGRSRSIPALHVLSPEEASKPKMCQHCNLSMTVKQINLTEAIRHCSNCFFTVGGFDESNIELIHRSFWDIPKDHKDWNKNITSEDEEIDKFKSWINGIKKDLNNFEEEIQQNDCSVDHLRSTSEVNISHKESDLQALKDLEIALVAASSLKSNDEDLPFSLDDLFEPLNPCISGEYPEKIPLANTLHSGPARETEQTAGGLTQGSAIVASEMNHSKQFQLDTCEQSPANPTNCNLIGISENNSFEEISNMSNHHPFNSSENSAFSTSAASTSGTDSSVVNLLCPISMVENNCEKHSTEITINSNFRSIATIDKGASLIEETFTPEESSLKDTNNLNKQSSLCKTYLRPKGADKVKQINDSLLIKKVSCSSTDEFQLIGQLSRDACTHSPHFPDLQIQSCLPKFDCKEFWMGERKECHVFVKGENDVACESRSKGNPHKENLLLKVSYEGKELFSKFSNPGVWAENPTVHCSSMEVETNVINISHNQSKPEKNEYFYTNSSKDTVVIKGETSSAENSHCCDSPQPTELLSSDVILIHVPATEDISADMLLPAVNEIPINVEEFPFIADVSQYQAFEFSSCQSTESLNLTSRDSDIIPILFSKGSSECLPKNNQNISLEEMYASGSVEVGSTNVVSSNCNSYDTVDLLELDDLNCQNNIEQNSATVTPHVISGLENYGESYCISGHCANNIITNPSSTEAGVEFPSVNPDEGDEELVAFCGSKFKPKPSTYQKSVKKYSDILSQGKYINLFHVIQKEVKDLQPPNLQHKKPGCIKSEIQMYDGV